MSFTTENQLDPEGKIIDIIYTIREDVIKEVISGTEVTNRISKLTIDKNKIEAELTKLNEMVK